MEQSIKCLICTRNSASQVCTCNQTLTPLCEICVFRHSKEYPNTSHPLSPLDSHSKLNIDFRSCPRDLNFELDSKSKELKDYRDMLTTHLFSLRNLKETFITLIQKTFHSAISKLESSISEVDEKLKKLNSDSDRYSLLRSMTIYGVLGSGEYVKDIAIYPDPVVTSLKNCIHLTYHQNLSDDNNLHMPIEFQYSEPDNFSEFTEDISYLLPGTKEMIRYDPVKHLKTVHNISIPNKIAYEYRSCKLPNGDLFLCGGKVGSTIISSTYIIHTDSYRAEECEPMAHARYRHAVIYSSSSIFVFGGSDGHHDISYCEEFDLKTRTWRAIASLPHAMGSNRFSVCLFKGRMFIPSVGFFDPIRKEYEYRESIIGMPLPSHDDIHILPNGENKIQILQHARKSEHGLVKISCVTFGPVCKVKESFYFIRDTTRDIYEYRPSTRQIIKRFSV
jgi:hypothetical protein